MSTVGSCALPARADVTAGEQRKEEAAQPN